MKKVFTHRDQAFDYLWENNLMLTHKVMQFGKEFRIVEKEPFQALPDEETDRIKSANSKMSGWEKLYKRKI